MAPSSRSAILRAVPTPRRRGLGSTALKPSVEAAIPTPRRLRTRILHTLVTAATRTCPRMTGPSRTPSCTWTAKSPSPSRDCEGLRHAFVLKQISLLRKRESGSCHCGSSARDPFLEAASAAVGTRRSGTRDSPGATPESLFGDESCQVSHAPEGLGAAACASGPPAAEQAPFLAASLHHCLSFLQWVSARQSASSPSSVTCSRS